MNRKSPATSDVCQPPDHSSTHARETPERISRFPVHATGQSPSHSDPCADCGRPTCPSFQSPAIKQMGKLPKGILMTGASSGTDDGTRLRSFSLAPHETQSLPKLTYPSCRGEFSRVLIGGYWGKSAHKPFTLDLSRPAPFLFCAPSATPCLSNIITMSLLYDLSSTNLDAESPGTRLYLLPALCG